MKSLNIGAPLHLDKLIESRMLIQASSGGGKSYMLRVLAEEVLPHMPVIIMDWDGEFASLREKFDIVLAGPDGEVPCDIKSASMLAISLVELQVSAVIDMSELEVWQRREYVKNFLSPLTGPALRKSKWPSNKGRAVMIAIDEAHALCPQKEKSVASSAVVSLQSLGRKRGLVGVLATQRLSKLNKDAAAECNNTLVGRCHLVDAPRACDILGLPRTYQHELTQMEVGSWKGIGPAFDPGIQEFKGKKAQTSHAKTGAKMLKPPAPSAKIKKVIPGLKAVQEKTVQEIKTLDDAKKELANVRRELTLAKKGQRVETKTVAVADPAAINKAVAQRDREWRPKLDSANRAIRDQADRLRKIQQILNPNPKLKHATIKVLPPDKAAEPARPEAAPRPPRREPGPGAHSQQEPTGDVTMPQLKILNSLAWWEAMGVSEPAKAVVAIMAGYKMSGTFRTYLGQLKTAGHIEYPGDGTATLSDSGRGYAKRPDAAGSADDVHRAWRSNLSGPQAKILDVLIKEYPNPIGQLELAAAAGYEVSGTFRTYLGQMRTFGLIPKRGHIVATALVFPENL